MTSFVRTMLQCGRLRNPEQLSSRFLLIHILDSLAELHTRTYSALAAAQTVIPAQTLPSSFPQQYNSVQQDSQPSDICQEAVQAAAASSEPRQHDSHLVGYNKHVVAALSGSDHIHRNEVTAASMQLLQLIRHQQARDKEQQQGSSLDIQVQQVVQHLHKQTQHASIPAEQLLQLLIAATQVQELSGHVAQALVSATLQSIPQLRPLELAESLTAISNLPGGLEGNRRALSKAVTAYLKQNQHAFDAASTAAVAAALAACKQHSSFALLSMLAMDHMQQMSPQQLVQLVAAFAEAGHYNQAIVGAGCKQTIALLQQQGHRLHPAHQADLMKVGTVAADVHRHHEQQEQVQQQALLTADDLVQLLSSCVSLRHHDAQLLESAAIAVVRSLKHLQLQQVVKIVTACAELNHYSTGLFEEACRLALQAVTEQQQQQQVSGPNSSSMPASGPCDSSHSGRSGQPLDASNSDSSGDCLDRQTVVSTVTDLAWSCALMNHLDVPFWQCIAAWSCKIDANSLSEKQLLQWYQVQSCLVDAAVSHPEFLSLGLNNHLLVAVQEAWLQKLQGQSLTPFHKEVHAALQEAGVRCRLKVALDGPLVVDVALLNISRSHRSKRVAVQLETPEMFAANSPHAALGPTAARWRALQSRGWQVLSLRYSDWRRLKTSEERALYAWNIRETLSSGGPGLAPDVIQPGSAAGAKGGKYSQISPALQGAEKLWKLLVK